MDGRVVLINAEDRRVAVRLRNGEYSVFKVHSSQMPAMGNLISGGLDHEGPAKLVNLSQRQLLGVDIIQAMDPVAARTKTLVLAKSHPSAG